MDLHGNVSWRLAAQSDLITCFRMAPHEDEVASKQRAVENLLARLESGKGRPAYKAYIAVPVLLPGEKTSTRIEPAKSIYAAIPAITTRPGIIDAAIWIGYAWADEPRNHAAVMVTGDDEAAVKTAAESLAASFWAARTEFEFVAPTLPYEAAMARALKSDKHPFFLSDMGDNPTAGGAGDVTWTLTRILEAPRVPARRRPLPHLRLASRPGTGRAGRQGRHRRHGDGHRRGGRGPSLCAAGAHRGDRDRHPARRQGRGDRGGDQDRQRQRDRDGTSGSRITTKPTSRSSGSPHERPTSSW